MSHILWKNLQAYNIQDSVTARKEHKIKTHAHLLGNVSQLNEFHTIPSQIFITYILHSVFSEMQLISSKELVTTQYSSSKEYDTFDRMTIGRTWLADVVSQDHSDYT